MKDLPAREKLDLASMVAEYLVLAGALDKGSTHEDVERANELSLQLAMLLPSGIYRAMVEAAAQPSAQCNAATVALLMRTELLGPFEGDLQPGQVALHMAGGTGAPKARGKAH